MWLNGAMEFSALKRRPEKIMEKCVAELTAHEAATLAAVIPNPRRYKPNGTSKYVENQSERIYQIMVRRGIVIPEYDDVISEKDENNSETSVKEKSAQGEQSISPEPLNTENKSTSLKGIGFIKFRWR